MLKFGCSKSTKINGSTKDRPYTGSYTDPPTPFTKKICFVRGIFEGVAYTLLIPNYDSKGHNNKNTTFNNGCLGYSIR